MFRLRRLAQQPYARKTLLLCAVPCLTGVLLLSPAVADQTGGSRLSPEQRRVQPPPSQERAQLPPGQRRVQPLDPLTPEETELAARIADSDSRVRESLGAGRVQLIAVEFLALKSPIYRETREPEQLNIGRHAAVVFYRYDSDEGVHVVVDLERRAVGEITRMEGRAVPLATAEVAEAFNLALRDERVGGLLGARAGEFRVAGVAGGERAENRVEALRIVAAALKDPCHRHRCLALLFRRPEGYITGTFVTVDLTAQTVRAERTAR